MTIWPLRPIWGVWKLYQWISHAQRPADRHRNQVSSILRTKVRSWPFYHILGSHKWQFGHSGQSGVSENGPNGFPVPKNLGIDTKIKSLRCSEHKLLFMPFYLTFTGQNGHKWAFWPLRSIWDVWKWSQLISHAQKPGHRHQKQVSKMFRTQVAI